MGRLTAGERFRESVRAILTDACLGCHSAEARKGGFDLSPPGPSRAGGNTGPAIVLRRPEESLIRGGPRQGPANWSSGFLSAVHQGTPFNADRPMLGLDHERLTYYHNGSPVG